MSDGLEHVVHDIRYALESGRVYRVLCEAPWCATDSFRLRARINALKDETGRYREICFTPDAVDCMTCLAHQA